MEIVGLPTGKGIYIYIWRHTHTLTIHQLDPTLKILYVAFFQESKGEEGPPHKESGSQIFMLGALSTLSVGIIFSIFLFHTFLFSGISGLVAHAECRAKPRLVWLQLRYTGIVRYLPRAAWPATIFQNFPWQLCSGGPKVRDCWGRTTLDTRRKRCNKAFLRGYSAIGPDWGAIHEKCNAIARSDRVPCTHFEIPSEDCSWARKSRIWYRFVMHAEIPGSGIRN